MNVMKCSIPSYVLRDIIKMDHVAFFTFVENLKLVLKLFSAS